MAEQHKLAAAVAEIDAAFGDGFAKGHVELVVALLHSTALGLHGEDIAIALSEIGCAIELVAHGLVHGTVEAPVDA